MQEALPTEQPVIVGGVAQRARLPLGVKLAYALPAMAGAGMGVPIAIAMTKFYSDNVGVALGFIALGQAISRAFDAISDPLMGWISDRTKSRWGRRRPWMALGAPLAAIFFVMLFSPPAGISPTGGAAWFTVSIFLFFVLNTIYGIPHYGLGPELTSDYHERSSLYAWRDAAAIFGTLIAAAVPSVAILVLRRRGVEAHAAERETYFWFSLGMAALLVGLYWWLVARVRENPTFSQRAPNPLVPGVRRVLRNRPFRILLGCYLVSSITAAIPGIFLPYYLQYVLGIGNWLEQQGPLLIAYFGSGLLSVPVWLRLTRRFGKKDVWFWHYAIGGIAVLTLYFLPAWRTGDAAIGPLYAVLIWAGAGFGCGTFLPPSMQADVIDYDELYTGKRREAQYGALWGIATKFAVIPGASIPLAALASMGFVPNVDQSESVVQTIRVIYGILPAAIAFSAMAVAARFPITEAIHRRILDGIEAHARGETATDPLTGKLVPPPHDRGLDEDTGWFLDHFSPGELRRALGGGWRTLPRDTTLAFAGALALGALSGGAAWESFSGTDEKPGAVAALGVGIAGLSGALACFHAIRIRAARRAAREGLDERDVSVHLELVARFQQRAA
jgi:GPH family glycoside/pentoside/hexuronide:cation symporter